MLKNEAPFKPSILLFTIILGIVLLSGCSQNPNNNQNQTPATNANTEEQALQGCKSGLVCNFGNGYACYGTEFQTALYAKFKECPINSTFTCKQYLGTLQFTDLHKILSKDSQACNVEYTRTFADSKFSMNNVKMKCYYNLNNEERGCSQE